MVVGRKWTIWAAVVMLILGLGVLLYPTVSSMINRQNGSYAIQELQEHLDGMDSVQMEAALEEARAYNALLQSALEQSEDVSDSYDSILDFGNGIMGYITIPKIDVKLPVYHGVSTEVLEKGIGHLPSSAFPIGGAGNHTVLTGHTGLPSAELFTDLTELAEGDRFEVTIGTDSVTYQVDQIRVVLPSETEDLMPVPGEDHCTLVTCTPYGVNSHRLLVRGRRIEIPEEAPATPQEEIVKKSNKNLLWLLVIPLGGGLLLLKRKRGRKDE